ncbi:anchored repeat-type ABC transporter permease subunit [Canibacter oris]|uniref:Manganese/iron transport system permease protein n=1 Tax=Canibacter oris TaxID=1365628 RepID=A0A840DHN2_9MICO|nr:anchored repeat-type ABC transporter permease subunit [Canibacter oris]MBB4071285.1 manganese/iron transport system permease protein [Canibacter oris]MBB4072155.1 manganese/iron transport system permease protein [Canibacter oris]
MPNPIDFIADLTDPELRFLGYALLLALLSAVVCGVLGTFVVLRGMAFIGDATAHAVFPGLALAFVLQGSLLLSGAASGVAAAAIIALLTVRNRVKPDTLIGILLVTAFASGIMIITFAPGYAGALQQVLFGSFGSSTAADVLVTAVVTLLLLTVVLVFKRGFVLVALDKELARTAGLRVLLLDVVLYIAVAVAVVVAVKSMGNILVLALLLTPAATARLITERLETMMLVAPAMGVLAAVVGMYLSWGFNLPSGAAIVLVATLIFGLCWLFAPRHGLLAGIRRRRDIVAAPTKTGTLRSAAAPR